VRCSKGDVLACQSTVKPGSEQALIQAIDFVAERLPNNPHMAVPTPNLLGWM